MKKKLEQVAVQVKKPAIINGGGCSRTRRRSHWAGYENNLLAALNADSMDGFCLVNPVPFMRNTICQCKYRELHGKSGRYRVMSFA